MFKRIDRLPLFVGLLMAVSVISQAAERKNALVATWVNQQHQWFATGPVQKVSVACKEEKEAIGLAGGKQVRFIRWHGNYKIYSTDRALESYERDIRKEIGGLADIP